MLIINCQLISKVLANGSDNNDNQNERQDLWGQVLRNGYKYGNKVSCFHYIYLWNHLVYQICYYSVCTAQHEIDIWQLFN